jgi:hypothetical protein
MNWPKHKDAPYWVAAIVVLALALWGSNARAETNIYAGAWSKHLITDGEYTSSHDLFAVEHKRIFAARFRNSYGRESYALGRTWTWSKGDVEAKVVLGAVRGYRGFYGDYDDKTRVLPLVVPMVSYTKYRVQPTVLLMGEALAVSIRVGF